MRKVFNIIIGIFSAIILLLSVVFIVLEGRLLFSGDWIVYDNIALGCVKYLFRFILALSAGTYAVFEFINMKKKSELINYFLYIGNIGLVIMSMVLVFTASNMVGQIALIISVVLLLIKIIASINLKAENPEDKNI